MILSKLNFKTAENEQILLFDWHCAMRDKDTPNEFGSLNDPIYRIWIYHSIYFLPAFHMLGFGGFWWHLHIFAD